MTAQSLYALALLAAALACVLFASQVLGRVVRMQRSVRVLDRVLDQRAVAAAAASAARAGTRGEQGTNAADAASKNVRKRRSLATLTDALSALAVNWLDTKFGKIVVAPEDRRLLDRCGFVDARARGGFFMARLGCALLFPLLLTALASGRAHGVPLPWLCAALTFGFLLPKMILRAKASRRQRAVAEELPLFVDLLRLLQGVGLSLDQCLQVMVNDFATVLPVLSMELTIAHRQFATGRTREQSLHRLATSYENDDLSAVVRLVIQIDKHGGAVQEPLKQFGDHLREARRGTLRERIGRLTVKMTGVMILTLLPALLIITAGPGFIAVRHALHALHP